MRKEQNNKDRMKQLYQHENEIFLYPKYQYIHVFNIHAMSNGGVAHYV